MGLELGLRHWGGLSLAAWQASCNLQEAHTEAVRRGGLGGKGVDRLVHNAGGRADSFRPWLCLMLCKAPGSCCQLPRPMSPSLQAQKPHGLQHLPLMCAGRCYLRTMSLISFTELSSLLKSCVAAGPPEAVAGQICSSRRLLSSLLMASRKANLFLICWIEST